MSPIIKKSPPTLLLLLLLCLISPQHASAYYDPGVQRWINRDPMGEAGGLNLYSFCSNSSVDGVDENGLTSPGGEYPIVITLPGGGVMICQKADSSGGASDAGNLPPARPSLPPGFTCEGFKNGAPVICYKLPPRHPPKVQYPTIPPIPCSVCIINRPPPVITF